jgi:hypothetical protein
MALALSYKGDWLGAWWSLDRIKQYIQRTRELRLIDYSSLRWLHVPTLASELEPVLRTAIQKAPLHFLDAWTNQGELPQGLHYGMDKFDSFFILRHFLWNELPTSWRKEAIKTIGACSPPFDEYRCRRHLTNLTDVSPLLLWDGIEQCSRKCKNRFSFFLQAFQNWQVDLPTDANQTSIFRRLSHLRDRVSNLTRLRKERLQELCNLRITSLETPGQPLSEFDRQDLLSLSARDAGRRYIAAHIAQHFLSRSAR